MTELTWHAGHGEYLRIHVSWQDHNNIPQKQNVTFKISDQDKPRKLEILVNGGKMIEFESECWEI